MRCLSIFLLYKPRLLLYSAVLLFALNSSGCVNYRGIHQQQRVAKLKQFATQRSIPSNNKGIWPNTDWAKQFADPQLSLLIQEAVAHNPDLQVAVARQHQAQALVEGRNAALYPQVDFLGTVARNKVVLPAFNTNSWQNFGLTALSFSDELDFWGKNYASLAQALSQEKVSQAALYESQLILSTTFAALYNQLDYEYSLRDVLRRTVKQRKMLNDITQAQLKNGLATEVQIYQAQNLHASAQTQLAAIEGAIVTTRQQLGVLLGGGPDRGYSIQRPQLVHRAIPKLPSNLPVNLLGRRPDIVAARWQVESALQGTKNIKARFYPNVNLYAVAAEFSFGIDRLFHQVNKLGALSPAVYLPLFDAGSLRAQLKGQYAVLDEQIATYNSTLNKALGDVAQQLSSIHSVDRQLQVQKNALTTAKHAYELSRKQYTIGLTSQIVVLDAETRYLEEQQVRLQLIKVRRDVHIALIKALGGGFNEAVLSTPRTIVSPDRLLKKDTHV